jgi:hypothetical protein
MSLLLDFLGETPELRVLDFFIENDIFDYSMADVSRGIGMARVTIKRVFDDMVKEELITSTRKVGKAQLYNLNKSSPVVQTLLKLDMDISTQHSNQFTEKKATKALA